MHIQFHLTALTVYVETWLSFTSSQDCETVSLSQLPRVFQAETLKSGQKLLYTKVWRGFDGLPTWRKVNKVNRGESEVFESPGQEGHSHLLHV